MPRGHYLRAGASRLADFLGLEHDVSLLLAAMLLIGFGEEMWMRFVPKYMEALGAPVFLIGLFDALKTLLAALYAYPGGVAADRWGHRRALVAFTGGSVAGYGVLIALPRPAGVIAAMLLFLAWSSFSLPAAFSLVARSLPAGKHVMGIGVQSLIKRVPIVLGPIAGGLLIDRLGIVTGVRAGAAVAIVFGLLAIAALLRLREAPETAGVREEQGRVRTAFTPDLRRLLASDILVRLCERIPAAWVVIYAMDVVGATASQVGFLIALEMVTAMLCYIPAAHLADRYGKEPFVVATFLFFTIFPLTLLAANSLPLLAVAFFVRGLKEFGDSARKALIMSYAPADRRGRVIGAYYLARDLTVTPAAFLGAALWSASPRLNFRAAFAVGAAGTAAYVTSLLVRPRGGAATSGS
ncbi:MAG: MFS transporter [Bryobacteraceae bacterium]|nr:MFS transporter [Bryobacteraceae bacterium]